MSAVGRHSVGSGRVQGRSGAVGDRAAALAALDSRDESAAHRDRNRFGPRRFWSGRGKAASRNGSSARPTAAPTIGGAARVIDGDTVVVAGTTVRLDGVDAAELGTARGEMLGG